MTKPLLIAFFIIAIFVQRSEACFKPDAPYCATTYGRFDDESDFDQCKIEMESYKSDVEEFLACQRRESQEAIDDYNEAVESFNRRARGY